MAREILKLTIIIITSVCFPTDNTFSKYFKYFCKLFAVYQLDLAFNNVKPKDRYFVILSFIRFDLGQNWDV